MNKKIVTLLKMIVLSLGLILLFKMITDKTDSDKRSDKLEYSSGDTLYGFSMGTSVNITLYGDDCEELYSVVMQEIESLDEEYISWRNEESELARLNSDYVLGEAYSLSDTLYEALTLSLNICKDSDGALDITLRPVTDVWNIEEADSDSFVVPDMSRVENALALVGYEYIMLRESDNIEEDVSADIKNNGTITINKNDMVIDLGATGKGYALDITRDCLSSMNLDGACVSVGGSILIYGSKDDGSLWKVGIRDPQGEAREMLGYLEFSSGIDICVSTSGYYEKYFMVDDVRYHHIIDRNTGKPSDSGLASVTVVCENGLYSDALSTACFVLGYEKSLALLEKYNADAVFVDEDNNIILTEGLQDKFIKK